jgi:hypothetical protein
MTVHVSQQTEARLTEEAQRQVVSVDALIERLMRERTASAPAPKREPALKQRWNYVQIEKSPIVAILTACVR